ncbi:MAG: adenylate/guanylate cyclase domain-containing protein [Verrucomicrobiales bacterium]|nr:adenylate/guanylate cyclase domain-containing protein [Verrucomicrobiales bacterium]
MRFQTKLVITLALVVTGVSIALVTAIEAKVRQSYVERFSNEFQFLMAGVERSRQKRSDDFLELCRGLASHSFIVESLKGGKTTATSGEFWEHYRKSVFSMEEPRAKGQPPGNGKRTAGNGDLLNKMGKIALMNLDGEVHDLPSPGPTGASAKRGQYRKLNIQTTQAEAAFERFLEEDSQQTLYRPIELADRKAAVLEMVSTPVKDPETGEILGFLLRSTAAETDAERSLERYQEEFGINDRIKSGIYVGGEVFSRTLTPDFSAAMAKHIASQLNSESSGSEERRFEVTIGEEDYMIYLDAISADHAILPAYQMAAFPISALRADLAEIRLRGSGIGGSILLLAIGIAFLLARGLSIPLKELAAGTEAIRNGNLDHQVKIRSSDEIGELASSFNEMAEELKQKAMYRELLGKVSDETVAQALVSGSLDLELGGEIKDVSVLFCDIRGFTQLTEEMHPGEVIELLNDHMTAMTTLVRKHGGVVDKFVGDEIMAVFGALKSYGNDALNAASCALEMIEERKRMNEQAGHPIHIGVGVATGEVVAGCMGSVDRLNYTVLGARVNLAARLCSAAGPLEVVTDDETVARISPPPEVELLSELALKGFSKPVQAYRIESIPQETALSEPALHS